MKTSGVSRNVVTVLKPLSNLKEVFPKMLMDISVSNLDNNTIKPIDNGGLASVVYSATHKLMISDTTLRSFIPPKVWKTTPKLLYIC